MSPTSALRETLQTARDRLRSGDAARAAGLFRAVLASEPGNAAALHGLARVALADGEREDAARLLAAAIESEPGAAVLHADLAATLQDLGRNDEALAAAARALELDPRGAAALNTRGNALRALGRLDESLAAFAAAAANAPRAAAIHVNHAEALLAAGRPAESLGAAERALALDPAHADAHFFRGLALRALGDAADAARALVRAIELAPGRAAAHVALGNALADLGDPARAEAAYRRAIERDANSAEAHYNLGALLQAAGRFDEARDVLRSAASLALELPDAHVRLGQANAALGRHDEALAAFEAVLALAPARAEAHAGRANALRALGRGAEAESGYLRALELHPESAETQCNLSTLLLDEGRLEAAEERVRRALALAPALADARWNRAQIRLARGDLARGFRDYEWRRWKSNAAELEHPYPYWNGEPLAGRTLLVAAEQGVGDEVMFATCVPDLIERGARVVLECDARLAPLFARSFPGVTMLPRLARAADWPASLPRPDAWVLAGSLPRLLRQDDASFPRRAAVLVPDAAAVERWRARYAALGGGPRIGISWFGGKDPVVRRARTIPLVEWRALAARRDATWVNLQYGDRAAELAAARGAIGFVVHHWPDSDPLRDLDDFAAQLAALDAVVSVDNSTVHLAGALGVRCLALVPEVADWRWRLEREDTPWYPSVTLVRQRRSGDWSDAFARVNAALDRRGAPDAPRSAPTARRAPTVALVNDTTHWYHWGCTATSTALARELERRGYALERVPISGLYALEAGPQTLADFDDPRVYARFRAANAWLWHELDGADRVVVNGEGSLHDLDEYVLNLLYVAYAASAHAGKPVQIVNHSCYPESHGEPRDSAAWTLYRKVYAALERAVVREPVSLARLAAAGMRADEGGDCLPLYVADHWRRARTGPKSGVVVAGSVAMRPADVPEFARFVASARERGLAVSVLTGASLLPAADDRAFVQALGEAAGGSIRLVAADSLDRWLDAIDGAALVVSGRFHHTLAAASLDTPFVLLASNTPKNAGLAAVLDAGEVVPLDGADLAGRIEAAAERALEAPAPSPGATLARLRARALANFDALPPLAG